MTASIDLQTYDPMEPSAQQNPFPFYAALREQAPVFRHPTTGIFFISRMDTLRAVLAEPRLFSSQASNQGTMPSGDGTDELSSILKEGWPPVNTMLTADPPAQTRYRKAIGKPFGTKRILELEPVIRQITVDLIDAWPQQGPVDFMKDFALPLPILAIAYALGMDPAREADIKRWSDDSVAALGVAITQERRIEAARGVIEMQKYWVSQFDGCRANPRGDILSNLVNTDFEDHEGKVRKLDDSELISMVQQLMVAGNETTTKLLNETTRLLIENPAEWKRIQDDPDSIPKMVEEAVRLSTPNQGMFRSVTADTELEGVAIPKGSMLWIIFGSANRDERLFPEPDRFDPTRKNVGDHIAFGHGAHFCIGAPLARLETRIAYEELSKRIENMDFAPGTTLQYEPSYILRGLAGLDIVVRKKS
jgi:cytochrome P450